MGKHHFTLFGIMLWMSFGCLTLGLRFEPRLPFLFTMLGLGITIALNANRAFPVWLFAVRRCFLAGLLCGPPLFVAGLYVEMANWPFPRLAPLSLLQLAELVATVIAGAWAGSLLSSMGGLLAVSLRLLRHRFIRTEFAATPSSGLSSFCIPYSFARVSFVGVMVLAVYGLPVGLMAIHGWRAHAEERFLGELEGSGLNVLPRFADSNRTGLTSPPLRWCDWWFSCVVDSRFDMSTGIPSGYWVIAVCPLSDQQSMALHTVKRR